MSIRIAAALLLTFTLLVLPVSEPMAQVPDKDTQAVMSSHGFLDAHSDLKWREQGLKSYERGAHEEAFGFFKRAARFADKPSQGMIAEMLWRGEGVAQDRAAAYAWMDLSAERQFRTMLIRREVFWESLTQEERDRAVDVGKQLYAEYGDAVAQPRLERRLRKARRMATGSRTGKPIGNLTIIVNTQAGPVTIDSSKYYDPQYWEPERYWAWQEEGWKNPPRGVVNVGPLGVPAPSSDTEQPPTE